MMTALSRFIFFRLMGWKLVVPFEQFPDKYVIPVVPHTSNWDFPIGLMLRHLWHENIQFVAKDSLFKWPLGGLFRWMGGVPVNRKRSQNFVEAVIEVFRSREKFKLCVAPEGTRSRVKELKTGFYYIAKGAGVPLLLCRFDYGRKQVDVSEPFYPTDDTAADLHYIKQYFSGIVGKNPENGYVYEEVV